MLNVGELVYKLSNNLNVTLVPLKMSFSEKKNSIEKELIIQLKEILRYKEEKKSK
jgi:hypothetical protein